MERLRPFDLTRLLGIVGLFGLVWWSIGFHQDAVDAMTDDASGAEALGSEPVDDDVIPDEEPPRYLAFSIGIPSGAYRIADLPDSEDTDYTLREPNEQDLNDRGSLAPGRYGTSFGVEGCSFELRRVMRTRVEEVIGRDHLAEGRLLVDINGIEPDRFVSSPECGDWVPWSPVAEPLQEAGNGDYWIGDLAHGTWTVPEGCIWEEVVGFRGANLWDVKDSAWGPTELVIDDETLGIRLRNCHLPMTLDDPS
ncbi:MAG: hypothetical protein AAF547_03050 [Actinomycetota bacterium]